MRGQLGLTAVIDYDGRRFRPAGASGPGTSVGVYRHAGDLVWAEFAGGSVRAGRLVGTCAADGVITAGYAYVRDDGTTVAGECVSTPEVVDGRVLLTERWRRGDGSSGVSHIEEIVDDGSDDGSEDGA